MRSQSLSNDLLTCDATWRPAVNFSGVARGEVHVWRAGLDRPAPEVEGLFGTLSPEERERARRFRFERDRRHFVVARGTLRALLGRVLDAEPAALSFVYEAYGKPALETIEGRDPLSFNVSHSGGLALYALARGRRVGLDLERVRADFASEEIAEQFFSKDEVRRLRALPEGLRVEGFFNCWTRKEAYIKGRGEGLSFPLDRFAVSLSPREPAELLSVEGSAHEAARWSLRHLRPGEGYVGAVAAEGRDWRLECWDWDGAGETL